MGVWEFATEHPFLAVVMVGIVVNGIVVLVRGRTDDDW